MNAMYSVEQVNVPAELGTIMKQYTKAVLRDQPDNIYKYSANFFAVLSGRPAPFDLEGQLTDQSDSPPGQGKSQPSAATAAAAAPSQIVQPRQSSLPADEEQEPLSAAPAYDNAEYGEPEDGAQYDEAEEGEMNEEDVVMAIFQKYSVGEEEGMTTIDLLPDLLAELRDALELSEDDLPPAEEIVALLNCEDGVIDLLELKQLLFESEEA